MNVSLTEPMEKFVRKKVAAGDYETASEVVREGLRLLRHRDEIWKNEVRSKIDQGLDSLRTGHALSPKQVREQMTAFKSKLKKSHLPK